MEIAPGCANKLFDRIGLTHQLRSQGINLPEPIVQACIDCALAREARNHLTVEVPAMVAAHRSNRDTTSSGTSCRVMVAIAPALFTDSQDSTIQAAPADSGPPAVHGRSRSARNFGGPAP